MNIIEDGQARVSIFCPLCGTQNVNEEGKITECTHFEGAIFVGDDDILFDKNGIFDKAQGKAEDIHLQVNELLDKKFSEEENKGKDRDKYWEVKNKAIQECYMEVGFPQEGNWRRINGTAMVNVMDILKTQLDNAYFGFYFYDRYAGNGIFFLYFLDEIIDIEET